MEENNDDRFGFVLNWTIDNFGCWNGDIHDPAMTIGGLFKLYPRGLSGREDRLLLRLTPEDSESLRGDVSFIGCDGSLLCTLELNKKVGDVLELIPGPKFRDVVDHIKNNGALHKDRLTLRLRGIADEKEKRELRLNIEFHSMIVAFETTVQINLELKDLLVEFYAMDYPLNNGEMESMRLSIKDSTTATDSVDLTFERKETLGNKFAVRALMSLLNSEGSLLRTEENEHVFRGDKVWVISNSLTKEEISQKGYSVVMDFKFIRSNGHKCLSRIISNPKAFKTVPKEISRSPDIIKKQKQPRFLKQI